MKNILSILISLLLLISAGFYEHLYLRDQFDEVSEVLTTLYDKTEERIATKEDGLAVQSLWEEKKKTLHILIPHSSITYIDYWLCEATGLIGEKKYDLALPKLGVLLTIVKNMPKAYEPSLENIL